MQMTGEMKPISAKRVKNPKNISTAEKFFCRAVFYDFVALYMGSVTLSVRNFACREKLFCSVLCAKEADAVVVAVGV